MSALEETDIFSAAAEPEKAPSLFVIKDGEVATEMTMQDIFDAETFDVLDAVTYVSSPSFFQKHTKGFSKVNLILGIDNSDLLESFARELSRKEQLEIEKRCRYLLDADEETQEKILSGRCQVRFGKIGVMIHDKIYLMKNDETKKYRVVIGSANFSQSAFSSENKNYENIRIDDDEKLYRIYEDYFQKLWMETSDYIPERAKRAAQKKEKLRFDVAEPQAEVIVEELLKKNVPMEMNISVTEPQQLAELSKRLTYAKEVVERKKETVELLIRGKAKDGYFPLVSPQDFQKLRPRFQVIESNIGKKAKEQDARKQLYYQQDTKEILRDAGDGTLVQHAEKASVESVRDTLERIDRFVDAYREYTHLDEENQHRIQQRIYESILFAFTSPFSTALRKRCFERDREKSLSDMPRFMLIGGKAKSGKTTALEFISFLLGETGGRYYQFSKISKGGEKSPLYNFLLGNNVFPLLTDEVDNGFLKKSNSETYGEGLIKAITNTMEENPEPVFIGTTNMDEYSASDQAARRIYYLEVSNSFDGRKKKACKRLLDEIEVGLTDTLFRDFIGRFSKAIQDKEDYFHPDDFLFYTRKIFKDYYRESGLEIPSYFPEQLFHDYEDRQKATWESVWKVSRDAFVDKGDGNLYCRIDELCKNTSQKKRLRNLLPDICLTGDSEIVWKLDKNEFYKFVGFKPIKEKIREMFLGKHEG